MRGYSAINKVDRVDLKTQNKVQQWLQKKLPNGVKIVSCKQGTISPDLFLGFNAAVEDNLDSRPNHHDTEEEHEHDEDITSTLLVWMPCND